MGAGGGTRTIDFLRGFGQREANDAPVDSLTSVDTQAALKGLSGWGWGRTELLGHR